MGIAMRSFTKREKAILVGLYLSRFDQKALGQLGFEQFSEAYNVLGYAIGVKPQSIKNYRDEFDPYFPNPRRGWDNRELRTHCREVLDEFKNYSFTQLTELVANVTSSGSMGVDLADFADDPDHSSTVASRLATGLAAEEYFLSTYRDVEAFSGHVITDMRSSARGFDFLAKSETEYYCVEVKGIRATKGSILLTEKEYSTARAEQGRYCLFVVSSFLTTPIHRCFFNPLHGLLAFRQVEEMILRRSFVTSL